MEKPRGGRVRTVRFHPYCVARIVLEDSMHAIEEKCNQQSYPAVNSVRYNDDWPGKVGPLVT